MQKVGIIGGLGPEATMMYYQGIIQRYQARQHSQTDLPELLINSVNMYHLFALLDQPDYPAAATYLAQAANELARTGADFAVMCGNTPHIVFDEIAAQSQIPLINMVTATAESAQAQHLHNLLLLGTKFTMGQIFFKQPFEQLGINIIVPTPAQQTTVHQHIVAELENGIIQPATKQWFLALIQAMAKAQQIDGVILGCTELPLLLKPTDITLPLLDTAEIHLDCIVNRLFQR